MAGVYRIDVVDGFQPVVVCLRTGLYARNHQRSFVGEDGVARNSLAAGDADACGETMRGLESYDVTFLYGVTQQSAIGQQPIAFDAQAIAQPVDQQLVAILEERLQTVTGDAVYGKG